MTRNNIVINNHKLSLISSYRWLITGGCGFIGTSLIKHILTDNQNANIVVLDNLSVGRRDDLSEVCDFNEVSPSKLLALKGVALVVGDIRNPDLVQKCAEGRDCVIHLAASTGVTASVENPWFDMENNVIGTFNVLEAARLKRVNKVIFASSGAPIGEVDPPIHEELAPHPISPYGASKLSCEGYCSTYFHTFGINTIVIRFGNVYGPVPNINQA